MSKEKITLVIQGPMHPNAMLMMSMHAHAFDIVFSTWRVNPEEEKRIEEHLKDVNCTKLVFNNIESLNFRNNQSNRFYQFYTTLKGMQLVDTEYVIKLRSDEYYTNLDPFVERVLANPEKIVTNEVFFRDPRSDGNENFMLHPSDHLYGGKTVDLIKALKKCVEDCKAYTIEELDQVFSAIKNRSYAIVPEQHLFANYLVTKHGTDFSGPAFSVNTALQLTKKACEIVKSGELGFYCISFFKTFSFYPSSAYFKLETDLEDMSSISVESEKIKENPKGKQKTPQRELPATDVDHNFSPLPLDIENVPNIISEMPLGINIPEKPSVRTIPNPRRFRK
jgi:hypothetical protein